MIKTRKLRIAGNVMGVIGGLGASALVGAALGPIVLPLGVVGSVAATLGTGGLGGIAADKVYEWYTSKVNAIADTLENVSSDQSMD